MVASVFLALLVQAQPFDTAKTDAAGALIREAIGSGKTPGLVAVAGDRRGIRWEQAFGNRQVKPKAEATTLETVWDMASLTKPVATATSIWILVDKGRIDPDQPVSRYLPDFKGGDRDKVTVRHLLTHTSGLTGAGEDTPVGRLYAATGRLGANVSPQSTMADTVATLATLPLA